MSKILQNLGVCPAKKIFKVDYDVFTSQRGVVPQQFHNDIYIHIASPYSPLLKIYAKDSTLQIGPTEKSMRLYSTSESSSILYFVLEYTYEKLRMRSI